MIGGRGGGTLQARGGPGAVLVVACWTHLTRPAAHVPEVSQLASLSCGTTSIAIEPIVEETLL